MKISAAEIEHCGRDVTGWVRNKMNPQGSGPRFGYNSAVKAAIYAFHKTGDRTLAGTHLRDLLNRFRNSGQKAAAERDLELYLRWYDRHQPAVAAYRVRLSFPLEGNILLGGEVSRVDADLQSGGYRAVLLGEALPSWASELRMPLIQAAVAHLFQRPSSEFKVGFQGVDGSALSVVSYNDQQLTSSTEAARDIARRLGVEWVRQGGTL